VVKAPKHLKIIEREPAVTVDMHYQIGKCVADLLDHLNTKVSIEFQLHPWNALINYLLDPVNQCGGSRQNRYICANVNGLISPANQRSEWLIGFVRVSIPPGRVKR
jgi:hypothetical protein